jgi:beta-glucuronidase
MTLKKFPLPALLFSVACAAAGAQPAPTLLVDVDHRPALSLDGDWHYIPDPYFNGFRGIHGDERPDGYFLDRESTPPKARPVEYNFAKSPTLKVPGDWNTQKESLFYYEGPLWYERKFDAPAPAPGTRVFLHIGAANYRAKVWLNGVHVGDHEGGFTPFDCEVTSALKAGRNSVVINVDNTRLADGVPTATTDWWNYGGLTRDVSLVTVPDAFVDDYEFHLSRADHRTIQGYVHVEHAAAGTGVHVALAELGVSLDAVTGADGRAAFSFVPSGLQTWSPETPKLYTLVLSTGADTLTDEMGFRTVEVDGTRILLNGKPIFLHGVCIHAEAPYRTGRAYSEADVTTLLGWAKELGCNFVRLAHYPHDQRMTRASDRLGILVWSEIPTYWALHFDDPAVLAKAEQQLHEEQRRDRDKASVILWSVANETPNTPARTRFLSTLADAARAYDPTRLVTAALLVRNQGHADFAEFKAAPGDPNGKIVDDPLGRALDVIGTNEYIGWYEKTAEDAPLTTWQIAYNKPVIMSEFGGDAKAGLHGSPHDRWTEEFQANIYRNQLIMLNKIPQLRGMSPWVLMDFRSPMRVLPGIQDDFNRKGLVAPDGSKKEAFFVLQKAYRENTVGKAQ